MALQIRRGTEAERTAGGGIIFAEGELIYVIDTDTLFIGDGSTPGGVLLASTSIANLNNMLTSNTVDDQLELEKDFVLNGNDITGTGNIDITGNINASGNIIAGGNIDIGDAPGDTVTITAQVDSSITPQTDTTFDLGTMSKRWRNVYANGATIDGQIDAVAINADVVADNSTVMVDVSENTFTGNLTGNLTGPVYDHTGMNLLLDNEDGTFRGSILANDGDVLLNQFTKRLVADVQASVFSDDSSLLVDAINGQIVGNVLNSSVETTTLTAQSVVSASNGSGNGIDLNVSAGAATGGTGDGGNISLTPGNSNGANIDDFGGTISINGGRNTARVQGHGAVEIGTSYTNGVTIGTNDVGDGFGSVVSLRGITNSIGAIGVGETDFYGDVEFNTGTTSFQNSNDVTFKCAVDFTNANVRGLTADVKGSLFADDSTVLVDAVSGTIPGENIVGTITGDLKGSVFADDSALLVDAVNGRILGEIAVADIAGTGNGTISGFDSITGNDLGNISGFTSITGIDTGDISGFENITGTGAGNITEFVDITVSGNIVASTLAGSLTGDVKGSVFADNSSVIIDSINNQITTNQVTATSLVGNITGDIFTTNIDSADSSAITVTPALRMLSDLQVDQEIKVGPSDQAGPESDTVKILPGLFDGPTLVRRPTVQTDTIHLKNIAYPDAAAVNGEILVLDPIAFEAEVATSVGLFNFGDSDNIILAGNDTKLKVRTFNGDLDTPGDIDDPANFDDHFVVGSDKAEFGVPAKFVVVADDAARSTLIPSPEKGMVILMESGTTPAATNQLQFYNGTGWANV